MNFRRALLVAALAAAGACGANRCEAQVNYGCAAGGYGYWDIGRLYGVLAQNVPHFAAFPPVYYSVPVPRTYGYSPFAYPPGVMTPEVVESPAPLSITNPFVPNSGEAAGVGGSAPLDQTTRQAPAAARPLVVINPFVRSTQAVAAR